MATSALERLQLSILKMPSDLAVDSSAAKGCTYSEHSSNKVQYLFVLKYDTYTFEK